MGTTLEEAAVGSADDDVATVEVSCATADWTIDVVMGSAMELVSTASMVLVGAIVLLSATRVGRGASTPAKRSVCAPCMKPYSAFCDRDKRRISRKSKANGNTRITHVVRRVVVILEIVVTP